MVSLEIPQGKIVFVLLGVVLIIALVAFVALPKPAPEGRRLGTERFVHLANVPVVSFASEPTGQTVTVDAVACSNGIIVANAEDCPELPQPEDCDPTLEAPVCGQDGVTYLNSCYAEANDIVYIPGICETIVDDFDRINVTDTNFTNDTNNTLTNLTINESRNNTGDTGNGTFEEVTFDASDGLKIYGSFYSGNSKDAIVLLHMLSKDKSSYASFAAELQAAGFNVLAIDLRGHGQSRETLQFETMTEQDFRNMQQDAYGAVTFLRTTKDISGKVFIVGASIGANTAINYGAVNAQPAHGDSSAVVNGIVALSPSFNYEGIVTQGVESTFSLPILTVSSKGEGEIHADALSLHNAYNVQDKELIELEGNAHGTNMLPEVGQRVIQWLKTHNVA